MNTNTQPTANGIKANRYEQQAIDFLNKVNAKIKIEYLTHDFYFPDDKECRDIYRFTISRHRSVMVEGKPHKVVKTYSGKFGNSINETRAGNEPNAYDILTCLEKYDVGSFEDFCAEFGYNEKPLSEYPQVKKIYNAVKREGAAMQRLFDDVMEELQEIQ